MAILNVIRVTRKDTYSLIAPRGSRRNGPRRKTRLSGWMKTLKTRRTLEKKEKKKIFDLRETTQRKNAIHAENLGTFRIIVRKRKGKILIVQG